MSRQQISAALRAKVRERAEGCCEYCRIPDIGAFFPHEPDHVTAERHGGRATSRNLALSCFQCNRAKGPNIASVDPLAKRIVPLFNPRKDRWFDHFRREGGRIVPLTPTGRATVALLNFNEPDRLEARHKLRLAGHHPLNP
jgi:hypothetical protein